MSNRLFTMIKSFVIPILAIVTLLVVAGYALSGCQGGQTKSIQDRYRLNLSQRKVNKNLTCIGPPIGQFRSRKGTH